MEENMDHFLLQNWPAWWQNSGLAFANSAFNSFEKNALANFWRDIGNLITGGGAGWAATRDSFFNRHFRGNQRFPARNATERALPVVTVFVTRGQTGRVLSDLSVGRFRSRQARVREQHVNRTIHYQR